MASPDATIQVHRIDAGVGHCDACGDKTPWGYALAIGHASQRVAFVCRSCEDALPKEIHIKFVFPRQNPFRRGPDNV